jgi:hypothetical protein
LAAIDLRHCPWHAAITAANRLGLPLLVLLTVDDRYPRATARRSTFLLGKTGIHRCLCQPPIPHASVVCAA